MQSTMTLEAVAGAGSPSPVTASVPPQRVLAGATTSADVLRGVQGSRSRPQEGPDRRVGGPHEVPPVPSTGGARKPEEHENTRHRT